MSAQNVSFRQIGTSGLRRYGGTVYEEFLTTLRWPYAGRVYQEMSDNDPVIGAILYLTEMLIRKTSWTVEPASDSEADIEAAEFIQSCMDDMDVSWAEVITEILSMLSYGFSFHEILYKIRKGKNGKFESKHEDGRIGWRNFAPRAQTSLLESVFDESTGKPIAFVQQAPPDYKVVTIPFNKGLLFKTRSQRGNPEGRSLLRNAYRPWYFKKRIEEIEGIGIERDLAGFPVLQAPDGLDLWNTEDPKMVALRGQAETLVANIRRDSEEGVLLPFGWDLKLLSTGSGRQFDTNAIINRYDNRIAITMLSDIVLIGGEKTGSFALADTKKSLMASALEAQSISIATIINKDAVERLIDANSFTGLTGYPKIVPGEIETPDLKEIALVLRAMGLDISKDKELMNFIRKVSSMPQLDDKTFKDIYETMKEDEEKSKNKGTDDLDNQPMVDDITNNVLEQSDMSYTGQ